MWGTIGFDWTNQYKFCFRASSIQSRVSELRTLLFGEVIQKLISKSYIEESSTLTKKKEIVTEIRLIETNPIFKHVQECSNWIESRQVCQIFVWSSTLQNIVLDKDFGNYETNNFGVFSEISWKCWKWRWRWHCSESGRGTWAISPWGVELQEGSG